MKDLIMLLLVCMCGCSKTAYTHHSNASGLYYGNGHLQSEIVCENKLKYCYKQATNVCGGGWHIVSGPKKVDNFWDIIVECKL